jgi:hypothetical protein
MHAMQASTLQLHIDQAHTQPKQLGSVSAKFHGGTHLAVLCNEVKGQFLFGLGSMSCNGCNRVSSLCGTWRTT